MPLSRASRKVGTYLALGPLLLWSASGRAETPVYASTWAQEALQGVPESLESPELRALRLAEEELFGGGSEDAPESFDPDCTYGVPDALTADAPPAKVQRAGKAVDVAFLSDLKLPSLPVRWDSRVIEYLLFFKNDRRGRDLATAWIKRMERYGPMIRRVLAEHSLPQDLQYVAMIESGYDPLAHSNQEAMGLWQFVKQAGQHYGLRVDHWTDERLDPERATEAAAVYMRDLYDRFGTWELAFAAYNMGYGALLRAIRKFNTNDYWLLSHLEAGLPFETSLYVAKITAMAIVASNPERFGFGNLSQEPKLELEKVNVPEGTQLKMVANLAGVDVEQLKALNPHLKKGRVPPGEPFVNVYVPRASYERFAQRWSKNKEPRQLLGYTVKFGETLEDVARAVGMSPAKLRDLNELSETTEVRAGFPLLVPAGKEPKSLAADKPVATVPAKEFRYKDRRQVFYRVAAQDTPDAIARYFDVTPDEVLAWNNLVEDGVLQRDMLIQLFVRPDLDLSRAVVLTPDQVQVLTVGTDEFFDFHETQRGRVRVRYRVQPKDTLASIAERFELTAGSVGRINQIPSNTELKVDDWVIVYVPEKQIPELEKKGVIARFSPASTEPAKIAEGQRSDTVDVAAEEANIERAEAADALPPSEDADAPESTAPKSSRAKREKSAPEAPAGDQAAADLNDAP